MMLPTLISFLPVTAQGLVPMRAAMPYSRVLPHTSAWGDCGIRQSLDRIVVILSRYENGVVRHHRAGGTGAHRGYHCFEQQDSDWEHSLCEYSPGVAEVVYSPHAKSMLRLSLNTFRRQFWPGDRGVMPWLDKVRDPVQDWCEPAVLSLVDRQDLSTADLVRACPRLVTEGMWGSAPENPGRMLENHFSPEVVATIWLRACSILLGTHDQIWPPLPLNDM